MNRPYIMHPHYVWLKPRTGSLGTGLSWGDDSLEYVETKYQCAHNPDLIHPVDPTHGYQGTILSSYSLHLGNKATVVESLERGSIADPRPTRSFIDLTGRRV